MTRSGRWAGHAAAVWAFGFVAVSVYWEVGLIASSDPTTTRWYLVLWEPVWLLSGALFLAAVWRYSRGRPGGHGPMAAMGSAVAPLQVEVDQQGGVI